MISFNSEGIKLEGDIGLKGIKILWDLLSVVGSRFVIVSEFNDDESEINYKGKYEVIKNKKSEVLILLISSQDELTYALEVLSDLCITDFYITVNSSFDNIKDKINSNTMFSDDGFLIEEYLIEFPRSIHVEEDNIFIGFKMFKEYIYQLQRVAQRYMK
ncbi:MAG: hypothetical protein JW791_01385 [Nanoarchaeota archaeon]|nr:hypothetical protein [Nanoarchaeota archaeon]